MDRGARMPPAPPRSPARDGLRTGDRAIGRATIDAYLDSVEQALMAAHAPRSDRLQVLQDLESQIAEMLAREPAPLTEESVRSVIEKLEPPRHFADTPHVHPA